METYLCFTVQVHPGTHLLSQLFATFQNISVLRVLYIWVFTCIHWFFSKLKLCEMPNALCIQADMPLTSSFYSINIGYDSCSGSASLTSNDIYNSKTFCHILLRTHKSWQGKRKCLKGIFQNESMGL